MPLHLWWWTGSWPARKAGGWVASAHTTPPACILGTHTNPRCLVNRKETRSASQAQDVCLAVVARKQSDILGSCESGMEGGSLIDWARGTGVGRVGWRGKLARQLAMECARGVVASGEGSGWFASDERRDAGRVFGQATEQAVVVVMGRAGVGGCC